MLLSPAAPSLSSVTLRLRHLDDIGLGEIALVIRKKSCAVRRLDLSGNFGNRGVKIFAEALKTNISLRTITLGCYKSLDDIGGHALLDAVSPFAWPVDVEERENAKRSDNTLQSLFILDRPTVTVNMDIIQKLESIPSIDRLPSPPATIIEDTSPISANIVDTPHVESKLLPSIPSLSSGSFKSRAPNNAGRLQMRLSTQVMLAEAMLLPTLCRAVQETAAT